MGAAKAVIRVSVDVRTSYIRTSYIRFSTGTRIIPQKWITPTVRAVTTIPAVLIRASRTASARHRELLRSCGAVLEMTPDPVSGEQEVCDVSGYRPYAHRPCEPPLRVRVRT
jgi:hypothetical protein